MNFNAVPGLAVPGALDPGRPYIAMVMPSLRGAAVTVSAAGRSAASAGITPAGPAAASAQITAAGPLAAMVTISQPS